MFEQSLNSSFYGNTIRWTGRIEQSDSWQNNIEASHFDPTKKKGWGGRYRVRILGFHTGDKTILPPDQCIMANVVMPVTSGSGLGGFHDTPALSAGTVVKGYFEDGIGGQEAFIDGIIINSNNDVPKDRGSSLDSGYDLYNDTYGNNARVPDFLQLIKPYEKPNNITNVG